MADVKTSIYRVHAKAMREKTEILLKDIPKIIVRDVKDVNEAEMEPEMDGYEDDDSEHGSCAV